MCSVYSAVSGEKLAFLDEREGKTGRQIKQALSDRIGISRFRQRIWLQDWSREIRDDEVLGSEAVSVHLVLLDYLPADLEEDRKMMAASANNDVQVIERLLQHPRNPNATSEDDGRTSLHHAAANGHVGSMRLLLEADTIKDSRDTNAKGWTPLLIAASRGHVDGVGLLIDARADINLATLDKGSTPLFYAAHGGHLEVVQLLIQARADIHKATTQWRRRSESQEYTPLVVAALKGHTEVVRSLREAGGRQSPVMLAVLAMSNLSTD